MTRRDAFPDEPLAFSGIVESGLRLWRRHFAVFFLLSVIAIAPGQFLTAWYLANNVIDITSSGAYLVADPDQFEINLGAISMLTLLINTAMWAALVNFGVNAYAGTVMSLSEAIQSALRRILPFIGLALAYFAMVVFGLVLLLIPGIYLAVRYLQAFPAFFAEGRGVGGALRRSGELVAGRWWRLFGLVVVSWLISAILLALAGLVVLIVDLDTEAILSYVYATDGIAARFYAEAIEATVLGALFNPVVPVMVIVAYYDGRARLPGAVPDLDPMGGGDGPIEPEADETGGGLIR